MGQRGEEIDQARRYTAFRSVAVQGAYRHADRTPKLPIEQIALATRGSR